MSTKSFSTLDSFFISDQNICDICSRTFKSKKSLASHKNHHKEEYRNRNINIHNARIASVEKAKTLRETKQVKYNLNPKVCLQCKQEIPYEKRSNKFCNHMCSSKYWNSNPTFSETKIKNLKKTWEIKNSNNEKIIWGPYSKIYIKNCKITKKLFVSTNPRQVLISDIKSKKEQYYKKCEFKFNVFKYPDEFDLNLIKKFGMYSTPGSNKKGINNPNGVSRDHKISINHGYMNNIDPDIISHPANCELMQHKKNKKKHVKNSITLEKLLIDIENWNKKYVERGIGFEPM